MEIAGMRKDSHQEVGLTLLSVGSAFGIWSATRD